MSTTVQKFEPMGERAPDDASIPVLTERLTLPPLELDTTLPQDVPEDPVQPTTVMPAAPAPVPAARPAFVAAAAPTFVAAAAPAVAAPAVAAAAAPAAATAGSHWTRIELELRASILSDIAESLPQEVDAIVRSRMSDAIDRLIEQLAAETRLAVAASLRDIVEHAVHSELDRLRGRKR